MKELNKNDIIILKLLNFIGMIHKTFLILSITTLINISFQYLFIKGNFELNSLLISYISVIILKYFIINRGEVVTISNYSGFRLVNGNPGYKILKLNHTEEIITEIQNSKINEMFECLNDDIIKSIKLYINEKIQKYDR